jgi:hypothetical protein
MVHLREELEFIYTKTKIETIGKVSKKGSLFMILSFIHYLLITL